jgi:PAS domain S-box-containing protein
VDDVKREIASIIRDLITISFSILLIIAMILAYIANQSYRALKERQLALDALRESEEKYRTLVESAAEGMFMVLDGSMMYANLTIADMLGYSKDDLTGMKAEDIFNTLEDSDENRYIQDLIRGNPVPERFEVQLKTKTGAVLVAALSTTHISLAGKPGYMAVVSDITTRKIAEHELGESEEKFRTMANNLNVGFFRMTTGKNPRFIEVNPALVELFGYESKESLLSVPVTSLYHDSIEYKNLAPKADESGLRREVVKFRKKDGTVFYASIWGVRINKDDKIQYFDGILEDITEVVNREEENRRLISELQSTLMFFNQRIGNLNVREVSTCTPERSVMDAARIMENRDTDVLLIRSDAKKNIGVLTHHDLRKALMDDRVPSSVQVWDIMSQGVISLPGQASVFEAWHTMMNCHVSHLFLTDSYGEITGVLDGDDVLAIQNYSPTVLLSKIRSAGKPEDIIGLKSIMPYLITTLIESGAKPKNINHLTTLISDTILVKFIEFSIKELGPPPSAFSFFVFGSEGREEQTLHTDQDNAII